MQAEPSDPSIYRPISFLPVISKVLVPYIPHDTCSHTLPYIFHSQEQILLVTLFFFIALEVTMWNQLQHLYSAVSSVNEQLKIRLGNFYHSYVTSYIFFPTHFIAAL